MKMPASLKANSGQSGALTLELKSLARTEMVFTDSYEGGDPEA